MKNIDLDSTWASLFNNIEKPLTENIIYNDEFIKFSEDDKKRIDFEKGVRHSINECINEELGVVDDVKEVANYVIYHINSLINNTKTTPSNIEGISQKSGKFVKNIFNKEITIIFYYYNFFNKSIYQKNYNKINLINRSNNNIIELTIVAISGTIDPRTLYDTIYHEVEHIFQKSITKKEFGGTNLYNHALIDKKSNNIYSKAFGEIIYLTRKFEQDAYINGLYGLLMSDDNDINYTLIHSDVYNALLELQKSYTIILNANKDDLYFKLAISSYQQFNYNYNKFIKEAKQAIKNINTKIGKVIIKSKNDKNIPESYMNSKLSYIEDYKEFYKKLFQINEYSSYK